MATVTSWTAAAIQAAINSINTALGAKADLSGPGGTLLDAQLPADAVTTSVLTTQLATKADLSGGKLPDGQAPNISVKKGDLLINVRDSFYGATGNGTTADDTALLNAIAAIPAGRGGIVYLPAGIYLINGATALTLSQIGTHIRGAGPEATKIMIGSGFSAAAAILINADDCSVRDLTIVGSSTTTTSNPNADAIRIQTRRAVVDLVHCWYINAWAVNNIGTAGSSSEYADGAMISRVINRYCAGGVRVLGNSASGYAVNTFLSNIQNVQTGVTSGPASSLDGIRIEDAWDVLGENLFSWVTNGLGHALHVVGNCAATFIKNFDGLGPNTASNVLIEDGANGSPQNVQINGGVIQQGTSGLRITGGASNVHVEMVRFINNQTHGISVEGTGAAIHLRNVFMTQNGAGATGTNYDINWTGTSTGSIQDTRFATAITASGTAGVQATLNLPSNAAIRTFNLKFEGAGASSANWYTNLPNLFLETGSGLFNFLTNANFGAGFSVKSSMNAQPSSSTAVVMSSNVNASDPFDRWRLDASGMLTIGTGSAARDVTLQRIAAGVWSIRATAQIGSGTDLGDGMVGGLKLADVTTVPASNPVGGLAIWSQSATSSPLKVKDTAGNVRGVLSAYAIATASQTVSVTAQTASTYLTIPVEASATYEMEAFLVVQTPSGVSFQHSWTGPTGATMVWGDSGTTYEGTIGAVDGQPGVGANKAVTLNGLLVTSTTAGSLTFTFASATASNNAILGANSFLKLTRIK